MGLEDIFSLNQPTHTAHNWTAFVITLPLLADAVYTLTRRLIQRENIFQAHRSHLYQRLQQSGLAHSTVASIYVGVTMAIALAVLSYDDLGAIGSVVAIVVLMGCGEVYINRSINEACS